MHIPYITRSQNNNLTSVVLDGITLHFSYETIVGFTTLETGTVLSENVWSATTNRHLNELDGGSKDAKASRLPHDQFTAALKIALATSYSPAFTGH